MLGRTESHASDGRKCQNKVLSGSIRKRYFQRLRPKANRLRHGTGSINVIDYLRIDLLEKEILRIRSFGCRLVDLLTRPFRKDPPAGQPEQLRGQLQQLVGRVTSHAQAFTQYVTQQQVGVHGSSVHVNNTIMSATAFSPFVTRVVPTTTAFSVSGLTATWERTPIVTPQSHPDHATQVAPTSTEIKLQEQQQRQPQTVVSSTSTSTILQQGISQTARSGANQRPNAPTQLIKVNVSAHRATNVQKTCCAVAHCATSHWHEPSTVRNPFDSPSVAANSLTRSIHSPQSDTTSRKRPYPDYDDGKQYYGEAEYPKRLKYYDAHIDETECSEYTSSDITDTDDECQPRPLISYEHSEVHVRVAPPSFTRHDLHTFRVAWGHLQSDTLVGDGEYPHKFENRGALPLRGNPPYYTFPLLPPGDTYGVGSDQDLIGLSLMANTSTRT